MRIEEPGGSAHADFKALGIALTREEALASNMREDFFAVADFVVAEDPAVNSYLMENRSTFAAESANTKPIAIPVESSPIGKFRVSLVTGAEPNLPEISGWWRSATRLPRG